MDTRIGTIAYLARELTALFPGRGVSVGERAILGESNIHLRYTHNVSAAQCESGIIENDPAFMRFALWKEERGSGYYVEYPTTHCGRVFDDGAVKFRKLKGKTEREVAEKLVAWFKKHQAHILSVGAKSGR